MAAAKVCRGQGPRRRSRGAGQGYGDERIAGTRPDATRLVAIDPISTSLRSLPLPAHQSTCLLDIMSSIKLI